MSNHDCNLKMDEFCCVCVAEEIEAKDAEIERLTGELIRMRQHCHKISAEMSDKAARERVAKLEATSKALRDDMIMRSEIGTYDGDKSVQAGVTVWYNFCEALNG